MTRAWKLRYAETHCFAGEEADVVLTDMAAWAKANRQVTVLTVGLDYNGEDAVENRDHAWVGTITVDRSL